MFGHFLFRVKRHQVGKRASLWLSLFQVSNQYNVAGTHMLNTKHTRSIAHIIYLLRIHHSTLQEQPPTYHIVDLGRTLVEDAC